MTVTVGRLRPDPFYDVRFTLLVHNTVRGAARAAALQQPKISPYAQKIKDKISKILDIGSERISIKATTTEKIGFVGREEGISVMAVVTVVRK